MCLEKGLSDESFRVFGTKAFKLSEESGSEVLLVVYAGPQRRGSLPFSVTCSQVAGSLGYFWCELLPPSGHFFQKRCAVLTAGL